jgi:hypothetical protein
MAVMTLRTHAIPAKVGTDLFKLPEWKSLLIGAWDQTALATQMINHDLAEALETATDPEIAAHFGWELVTIAVETIELMGSMLLNHRDPTRSAFHQASNRQLKKLFTSLAEAPLQPGEIQAFLHLTPPGPVSLGLPLGLVLGNASTAIQGLATFWTNKVEHVRSFRHYPGGLQIADLLELDPQPHPARDKILEQIAAIPDRLDVFALPDKNTFEYIVLTKADAKAAPTYTQIAIQLIFTGNALINPNSPHDEERLPTLYPALLVGITDAERELLKESFHLV